MLTSTPSTSTSAYLYCPVFVCPASGTLSGFVGTVAVTTTATQGVVFTVTDISTAPYSQVQFSIPLGSETFIVIPPPTVLTVNQGDCILCSVAAPSNSEGVNFNNYPQVTMVFNPS